jgi:DNA repair protein RadC
MLDKKQQIVVDQAISILETELAISGEAVGSSADAQSLCRLKLSGYEHEVFAALFLNSQHQLISFEELFSGTVDSASVYPREVVKKALKLNAAAVIFSHNHPSGVPLPSQADKTITERLVSALDLVDIRVLDHLVVGRTKTTSFSEEGLL